MVVVEASEAMRFAVSFAAIASIVGSAEWLYLHRQFKSTSIYSWKVRRTSVSRPLHVFDKILDYPVFLLLPVIQLLFSFLLLLPNQSNSVLGISCLAVACCYFLLSYRGVDGFNGGDAMAKLIMLTGSICYLSNSDFVIEISVYFIAFQMIVAYSTPGWFRIFDSSWHNGTKILGVMRTESFGRESVWKLLSRNPRFTRFVSSSIAIWEALFVLYLLLPPEFLLLSLAIGIVFHYTNAVVMGLNIFIWSFIGSYPSIFYSSQKLRLFLFG